MTQETKLTRWPDTGEPLPEGYGILEDTDGFYNVYAPDRQLIVKWHKHWVRELGEDFARKVVERDCAMRLPLRLAAKRRVAAIERLRQGVADGSIEVVTQCSREYYEGDPHWESALHKNEHVGYLVRRDIIDAILGTAEHETQGGK